MELGRDAWTEARTTIQTLLAADNSTLKDDHALLQKYESLITWSNLYIKVIEASLGFVKRNVLRAYRKKGIECID